MFILSFPISFVVLVVILLILCVILLWDSATAHSTSGKELSSLEESCYSRLIVLLMLSYYPAWALLVWYSPILLIKSTYEFILFVVYFYSERPPLSKILYSMCGLFLCVVYFYVWSISMCGLFYVWSISPLCREV